MANCNSSVPFMADLLDDTVAEIESDNPIAHYPFPKTDVLLGGIRANTLTIVTGESGIGKTTWSLQVADAVAQSGKPVVYVSLEMSRRSLLAKSLSRLSLGTLPVSHINGQMGQADREALSGAVAAYSSAIASNMVILEGESSPVKIASVVAEVARIKQFSSQETVRPFVVVDYVQILTDRPNCGEERAQINAAMAGLRQIALDQDVAVMMVSSVNRASYGKPPSLGSIGGSSSLEYGCDTVLHLGPAEKQQAGPGNRVRLTVLKQRFGCKGHVDFGYDAQFATYFEL